MRHSAPASWQQRNNRRRAWSRRLVLRMMVGVVTPMAFGSAVGSIARRNERHHPDHWRDERAELSWHNMSPLAPNR